MLGIVTAALKIAASEYEHVSSGSARVAAVQRTVRLKIPSSPGCCCAGTIVHTRGDRQEPQGSRRTSPGPGEGLWRLQLHHVQRRRPRNQIS